MQDRDLGSGGLVLLPDLKDDSGKTRHLAVGAGKADFDTGRPIIYVVDRDAMGKFDPRHRPHLSKGDDGTRRPRRRLRAARLFQQHDLLRLAGRFPESVFRIAHAKLAEHAASRSPTHFSYPGTTPSISANGSANAIVWAVEASTPGVLHAYDAANLAHELYNSNQAPGGRDQFVENKFITPMIANGKVFIGTPDSVVVFGLLQPSPGPGLSRNPRRKQHALANYTFRTSPGYNGSSLAATRSLAINAKAPAYNQGGRYKCNGHPVRRRGPCSGRLAFRRAIFLEKRRVHLVRARHHGC